MIDDLFLYRASDDYKQVIEERFVLPEYDKIFELSALLQRTGLPVSARVLRESGFSELTEELKECTSISSSIVHGKLDDDQLISNVELEKRISCYLARNVIENIDEIRLLDICLESSRAKWTKRKVESQLAAYNNTLDSIIDFFKDLKDYDIEYDTAIKYKGVMITDLYLNNRLYISFEAFFGGGVS